MTDMGTRVFYLSVITDDSGKKERQHEMLSVYPLFFPSPLDCKNMVSSFTHLSILGTDQLT